MERYNLDKKLGDGSYGVVYKATDKRSGTTLAIKKMKRKFYSWDECMALREIKSLRKLTHPNIVRLKEVIRENDELFFVFEYMEGNLYDIMKDGKVFSEHEARKILWQLFDGLAYMHKHGFFHRDIKPENCLIKGDVVKLADFGLAREIRSRPPYTDYVSTRWYRAPEVLLHSPNYNSPIDMFAMGAIMGELLAGRPLFPGKTEADQIFRLCSILGVPSQKTWAEGMKLATAMKYSFPIVQSSSLNKAIPTASDDAIDLMEQLLAWDPQSRPSCASAMQFPFFSKHFPILLSPRISDEKKEDADIEEDMKNDRPNIQLNFAAIASSELEGPKFVGSSQPPSRIGSGNESRLSNHSIESVGPLDCAKNPPFVHINHSLYPPNRVSGIIKPEESKIGTNTTLGNGIKGVVDDDVDAILSQEIDSILADKRKAKELGSHSSYLSSGSKQLDNFGFPPTVVSNNNELNSTETFHYKSGPESPDIDALLDSFIHEKSRKGVARTSSSGQTQLNFNLDSSSYSTLQQKQSRGQEFSNRATLPSASVRHTDRQNSSLVQKPKPRGLSALFKFGGSDETTPSRLPDTTYNHPTDPLADYERQLHAELVRAGVSLSSAIAVDTRPSISKYQPSSPSSNYRSFSNINSPTSFDLQRGTNLGSNGRDVSHHAFGTDTNKSKRSGYNFGINDANSTSSFNVGSKNSGSLHSSLLAQLENEDTISQMSGNSDSRYQSNFTHYGR